MQVSAQQGQQSIPASSGGQNYQTVQSNGASATAQPKLNMIAGTNTTVACANNAGNSSTDCHVDASTSGAGLATDNIFTNNNRFKGPIPYRDFTAYMPAGGCSSANTGDPPATGTISSGSPTLTVSGAADFRNGCGLAIIGAGPTATLAMATTATGTTTRSGTLVTFTVTSGDPHLVPGIGDGSDFAGFITVTGCSDANFNTTGTGWLLNFGTPVTSLTYNTSGSGGTTATGCTATFYYGYAHGTTGATTWNYKVAPIDSHGGVGAAIGPIAITNGNATLGYYNYNWISYQATAGAREFAIYRDDGAGGAYTCRDLSYSQGYSDYGRALPFGCPAYVPSTPPGSPTAQTLNTTIASGGGTTTLTLAVNASNTATTKNVYNDNSMFLASCISDVVADQAPLSGISSSGCFIPYGRWFFNADMPTDTISASNGVGIRVAGTPVLQSWPWMVKSGYTITGEGSSGGLTGINFPYTRIERGVQQPAGLVLHGNSINISGLGIINGMGDGVFIGTDPSTAAVTAGVRMKNIVSNVQDGLGIGVPLRIDGNALFMWFENMNFIPRSDGFPASILFTETQYTGNGHSDIFFHNIYTLWHHIVIDSPGGQNSGQGTNFTVSGSWTSEEHGQYTTGGTIHLDYGVAGLPTGATSTSARLAGATLYDMQNADASNKYLVSVSGSQTTSTGGIALYNVDEFTARTLCLNGSTLCTANGYQFPIVNLGSSDQLPTSIAAFQGLVGNQYLLRRPLVFGNSGFEPSTPLWANEIPGAINSTVTSTGAGSLSAATYCFEIVGVDSQTTPGLTIPSPELCQTVGASSSINLKWQLNRLNEIPNWRVYFGTSAGGENNYFTVAAANSTDQTYAFTTTAAATGGSPPSVSALGTAYSSWLQPPGSNNGPSCLLCVPTNVFNNQIGIGDPAPPSGSVLSVKGGTVNMSRPRFGNSTASVAGDLAFSGWGGSATKSVTGSGTDNAAIFLLTAGTAPSANPTITWTFKDGAWSNTPVCTAITTGGTDTIVDWTVTSRSTTAYTFKANFTPTNTLTEEVSIQCSATK